jgi:hypothetical protein
MGRRPRAQAARRLSPRETIARIDAVAHGDGLWCWLFLDRARRVSVFLLSATPGRLVGLEELPPGFHDYRVPIPFADLSERELAVLVTLPRERLFMPPTHVAPSDTDIVAMTEADWSVFAPAAQRALDVEPAPRAAVLRAARADHRRRLARLAR